ncbi:cytochrome P450 [Roridomyces roridus]|uniref:Cytochrome P450 n=1 Tax=Roridomyces roridus TaxID=1738132 RepID=A0AAD7C3Q0_9AGAR|nr:cytochrome P450 [Roridomyces roridus]
MWLDRKTSYFNRQHDIVLMNPLFAGAPILFVASRRVVQQLLGNEAKLRLVKPVELTLQSLIGDSLASASGDAWRRHRRILSPAFNTSLYSLAWDEASVAYEEVVYSEGWLTERQFDVSSINHIVHKFSLMMISRCAFGIPLAYEEPTSNPANPDFPEALVRIIKDFVLFAIVPRRMFNLPFKRLRIAKISWQKVESEIKALLRSRSSQESKAGEDNADILGRLVSSSGKLELTREELFADIFTLMFAGHETTASVITTTLGYLALYHQEQDAVAAEITSVVDASGNISFASMSNLPKLQACLTEALRLIPPPLFLPRDTEEDITLEIEYPEKRQIVVPRGSRIIIDMVATLRNPSYFPNPDVFKPSRWLEDNHDPDAVMFGAGPRQCIGRRFAQSTIMRFVACLLRDFEVDALTLPGETREEYEERIMTNATMAGTSFTLQDVPLRMTRRIK